MHFKANSSWSADSMNIYTMLLRTIQLLKKQKTKKHTFHLYTAFCFSQTHKVYPFAADQLLIKLRANFCFCMSKVKKSNVEECEQGTQPTLSFYLHKYMRNLSSFYFTITKDDRAFLIFFCSQNLNFEILLSSIHNVFSWLEIIVYGYLVIFNISHDQIQIYQLSFSPQDSYHSLKYPFQINIIKIFPVTERRYLRIIFFLSPLLSIRTQ